MLLLLLRLLQLLLMDVAAAVTERHLAIAAARRVREHRWGSLPCISTETRADTLFPALLLARRWRQLHSQTLRLLSTPVRSLQQQRPQKAVERPAATTRRPQITMLRVTALLAHLTQSTATFLQAATAVALPVAVILPDARATVCAFLLLRESEASRRPCPCCSALTLRPLALTVKVCQPQTRPHLPPAQQAPLVIWVDRLVLQTQLPWLLCCFTLGLAAPASGAVAPGAGLRVAAAAAAAKPPRLAFPAW